MSYAPNQLHLSKEEVIAAAERERDKQIRNGVPELASKAQSTVLELKPLDGEDNPLPEGMSLHSVAAENRGVEDPIAVTSPVNRGFLTQAARSKVSRFYDDGAVREQPLPHVTGRQQEVDRVRAEWAVDLTGRYRLGSDGSYNVITDGDCLYGRGEPREVAAYLRQSGFSEIDYDSPEEGRMPNVAQLLHNQVGGVSVSAVVGQ